MSRRREREHISLALVAVCLRIRFRGLAPERPVLRATTDVTCDFLVFAVRVVLLFRVFFSLPPRQTFPDPCRKASGISVSIPSRMPVRRNPGARGRNLFRSMMLTHRK